MPIFNSNMAGVSELTISQLNETSQTKSSKIVKEMSIFNIIHSLVDRTLSVLHEFKVWDKIIGCMLSRQKRKSLSYNTSNKAHAMSIPTPPRIIGYLINKKTLTIPYQSTALSTNIVGLIVPLQGCSMVIDVKGKKRNRQLCQWSSRNYFLEAIREVLQVLTIVFRTNGRWMGDIFGVWDKFLV